MILLGLMSNVPQVEEEELVLIIQQLVPEQE